MTQAVLSAEFYGTSYAVFPPFDATAHFDITLMFRTDFGDGLLLFAGSALQVGTSLEQYALHIHQLTLYHGGPEVSLAEAIFIQRSLKFSLNGMSQKDTME